MTAFVTSSLVRSAALSSRSPNPDAATASNTKRRAGATVEGVAGRSADLVVMIVAHRPLARALPSPVTEVPSLDVIARVACAEDRPRGAREA